MLVNSFIFALVLSIASESLVSYIMGYRGRQFYLILSLVNIMSNPLMNYILTLIYSLGLFRLYFLSKFILEAVVIIFEYKVISYALPKEKKLLSLSIIMNFVSYMIGVILSGHI